MRVPDEIRKTVLFIGVKDDRGEWDWKATGYVIGVPGINFSWEESGEVEGKKFDLSTLHPFRLLATAKHVAKKLEGKDFALRTMTHDGQLRVIEAHASQRWFYHPSEKEHIDAAVTIFLPPDPRELDLFTIHTNIFATEELIEELHLGAGDEVFIAGLFSKVKGTSRQNAIIRTGNLAMMPGEKIEFGDELIHAYLVESRSIGGLSGSPVFVRETIRQQVAIRLKPGKSMNNVNDRYPGESFDPIIVDGPGRMFFLGSMIGHWDTPSEFDVTMREAVNMGVAPVVPAQKILEIIQQPELIEMAKRISADHNRR